MTLLVRTDASVEIGSGHVMRCLALAQAWQSEGRKVTFLMADAAPALEARINAEGFAVIHHPQPDGTAADSHHTIAIAQTLGTKRVVVDGYHFGAAYQQQLKAAGLKMLFIDDNGHADHYAADWVLNQNIYAHEGLYPHREPYTQLLLGTEFALLRQEFWPWRGWRRQIVPVARKILVTLGGSDPDNVTLKVMQALQEVTVPNLEVIVVVGGSNPNFEGLQTLATNSSVKFDLRRNVDNMPELMAWADVAISGSGSTCWELAFMGLPSLVIPLAINQEKVAQALSKSEITKSLLAPARLSLLHVTAEIEEFLLDKDLRVNFSQLSHQIIDGNGSYKVAMMLENDKVWLRAVQLEDCQLLWRWANDPIVRSASFSQQLIPYEQHEQWFLNKLKSSSCRFYIAFNHHNQPIGQIRFDFLKNSTPAEAEVSISIDAQHRSKGFGKLLIQSGVDRLFQESNTQIVYAFVKPENLASIKSFELAGFRRISQEMRDGTPASRFVKYR